MSMKILLKSGSEAAFKLFLERTKLSDNDESFALR